ncbi:MAG: hypothetical protein COZ06_23900 [Armatimonadetes bacterium CG_4_10_14_3_um_filter_66_18]|nr:hypothetical protein [Armatimonadota bacterium]PIU94606.1 MAG: hypothetical protein COS65_06835 [Armatimonadetes bacterium CG06_land_8_20_14_3_00_66_21]PIX46658.1 MAG: hypothetical protein COZ57_10900 [Armatimonadetes bacterium CG_4_8_14_3_um_filter_66_20]PIY42935.1 MAG: hypothetical protein COZ06_23900 [Armatimonadetes bacterium CG_4_10_14_3_um_filter_66_18]PIZ45738.1 MAG: hypothetical protein COY42_11635 [Armatimonadetes bacterium CG_4_10_14_0_8_um_filter_66_14]PJB62996.1 MAG: hypothetica
MDQTQPTASFWHSVAVVWRLEVRRLWSGRQVLGLVVAGAVAAMVAALGDDWVSLVRARVGTQGTPAMWAVVTETVFPDRPRSGPVYALFCLLDDHGRRHDVATVSYLCTCVFRALRHYLLPGIAALSLAAREEQWRVDVLRHGGVQPTGLLVGKWLGALTPFVVLWLALTAAQWTWVSPQTGHRDALALFAASSVCLLLLTAMLGLCASALCRHSGLAVVLAYVLCWGVSFAVLLASHQLVYGAPHLGVSMPGESCARLLTVTGWTGVLTCPLVLVPAFLVARWGLQRRWPGEP